MKPKKVILLIDANEERRGELAYALRISGFKVIYEGPEEVIDLMIVCLPFGIDLVDVPLIMADTLVEALMIMADTLVEAQIASPFANCHITFRTERSVWLESIKTLTARKRGPKKCYQ